MRVVELHGELALVDVAGAARRAGEDQRDRLTELRDLLPGGSELLLGVLQDLPEFLRMVLGHLGPGELSIDLRHHILSTLVLGTSCGSVCSSKEGTDQ